MKDTFRGGMEAIVSTHLIDSQHHYVWSHFAHPKEHFLRFEIGKTC